MSTKHLLSGAPNNSTNPPSQTPQAKLSSLRPELVAMEGLRGIGKFSESRSASSSSLPSNSLDLKSTAPSALPASDSSLVLATRPPRNMVSLGTCSKLCAVCFVAGVVFGYTLRRRVRSWASNLLKRLKDN